MVDAEILRHRTADHVADAVAIRLITRLVDIQNTGRVPSVVLTGGSIAVKIHSAIARSPARGAVDWELVEVWFGDERFVPSSSPDRNAGQAAEALLDRLPFDPARIHPMPASDGEYGDDVDAAAAGYAEALLRAGEEGAPPAFDVLMLGIGPDGHCASLFPGRREMYDERPVVAVRDSPKPPPTRISLTFGPLGRAHDVWWVAAGEGKARAVHDAVAGADPQQVPAAGPTGRSHTLWFLDDEAAALL